MIKHIRQALASSFFLFILTDISGQESAVMLESLSEKFLKYCKTYPREEVYVQTDREAYIAGENIWFKIYLFDRQSNRISSGSSIAYFEVLNSENRPVVQKRIKLEMGLGPGEVILSDTLGSGSYTIRSYTNWMKNFLPSNCFMKKITVYNSVNNKNVQAISAKAAIPVTRNDTININKSTETGIKIQINNSQADVLRIKIETDRNFRSSYGSQCFMLIQTHGVVNFKSAINLSEDIISRDIPKNMLLPGINQIVLFNQAGKLIAEKYIYTPSKEPEFVSLNSVESIKRREKIILEIELDNKQISSLISPELSISVAETREMSSQDIADYMIFGSEFGTVPPEVSNSDPDEVPAEVLDGFLSTLKSNWIDWNKITSGIYPVMKYNRESVYHYLTGRLLKENIPVTGEDKFLFLSVPGKKATFQYSKTDNEGNFSFRLPVNSELRDLIIQPEFADKDLSINIQSPYSDVYSGSTSVPDTLNTVFRQLITQQGVNYQVMKIYESDQPVEKAEKPVFSSGAKRFYGKPDIQLIMDDYIKLPVMQEVFFELMPGVNLKKRRSLYEITVADPVDNRIFEKPPVLFVDGVVIHDAAIIADIDPETVEEIDAIKERYMVGEYLFYGIVNVITNAGDYSSVNLPDFASRLAYRVTDPVKQFPSPDYSTSLKLQSRLPDFRNTLYWNPTVRPDKEGKARVEFWSSDFVTDYVINIQGITSDGNTIALKKLIKIRDIR